MKVDILAFGAHPDDVELSCSGTLLKQIALGATVGLVDLTRGELGSRGSAELRDEEGARAASLMGAAFRENLRMADGFFRNTPDNIRKVIRSIRAHRPKIVLANSLSDRHPDHGRAAKLVAEACFYAGLMKIGTYDEKGQIQEKWRPEAVYHYIQDHNLEPDFVVDISDYIDQKIELVQAFSSQFFNPKVGTFSQEPTTPISTEGFIDFLRAKAMSYGRIAQFKYAEGFQTSRTPGIQNLFDLV